MAVKVKIRLRAGIREVATSALVNTGFESPAPDAAVPTAVAKAFNVNGWFSTLCTFIANYLPDTAFDYRTA